ncbi:MAG: ferredoxin [Deferrisomatales bacterium]|nr:ferredoxin [Deferrisomatales bacterium]
MKVRIDYDECMGDGNCHKVCPEVFGYDDDKMQGVVLKETVPVELEGLVRSAAMGCAVAAVLIDP